MTGKEKAKYIDHFLAELKDASFPSSMANILELKQFPSRENEDKFKLLEYELEKHDLVKFVRGRDNSTLSGQCEYLISGKGLDYVMSGKSTLELFDNKEHVQDMNDPYSKLEDLTQRAESYSELTKVDFRNSKVNTRENINLFTEWYFESRDLFGDYFDENEKNYADFSSCDVSGNGYTLSERFSRIYPLFKILKGKILRVKLSSKQSNIQEMTNKGFVIHGHNESLKLEVARYIEKYVMKEAIILHEQPNKGKTVIEKFESNSEVDFAVALWTVDDQGKSTKEEKLQKRARQNVIFETGYFIGKLGRERVIILFEDGVEKPSDYNGVVYISLSGNWMHELKTEIESIYN